MLDLYFDSVLDASTEPRATSRTLRFVRGGCRVKVDVHGVDHLTVDVESQPCGSVTIAALRCGVHGTTIVPGVEDDCPSELPPGLTSFVLHWAGGEHRPARTAWVVL